MRFDAKEILLNKFDNGEVDVNDVVDIFELEDRGRERVDNECEGIGRQECERVWAREALFI